LYKGVQPVAIKVIRTITPDESLHEGILKEVSVLRACRHPHVIQVIHLTGNLTNITNPSISVAVLVAFCHPHFVWVTQFGGY
jgi:serine/threonine protein kinase